MANENSTLDRDDANTATASGTIDKLTGTTAETRADLLAKAQETLAGAVSSAVDAVKANPKTAAAIAAGATAAVAGAAYGATKLAKGKTSGGSRSSGGSAASKSAGTATAAKRTPAKRTPAAKK